MINITSTTHTPVNMFFLSFTIDLQLALPNGQFEKILHISIRFERKEIVRNTQLSREWGPEERFGGMGNLQRGERFECILLVQDHRFRVQ